MVVRRIWPRLWVGTRGRLDVYICVSVVEAAALQLVNGILMSSDGG